MKTEIRPALTLLVLFTLLTGVAYPLVTTGIAQVVFPHQANGSLVVHDGRIVGSALVGQTSDSSRFFWGRRSATAKSYDAMASTGSNLGPSNPALAAAVQERVAQVRGAHPEQHGAIPGDLVTASASGLDPDLTPAAARYQVDRVARARGLDPARVRALLEEHIEGRTFGALGEAHVNVLALNLALERMVK